MDGWICKLMSVLLIKLKKDEEEKRSNLIGEEGLPSILKQATTKSNYDQPSGGGVEEIFLDN